MIRLFLLAATFLCTPVAARADEADLAALLDGVETLGAPGVPGPLAVCGPQALAVVAGGGGKDVREPVVAAARWGRGRVVAFGHTGYLDAKTLSGTATDTGRLMQNAVRWAAGTQGAGREVVVGTLRADGLRGFLEEKGFRTVALPDLGSGERLRGVRVLCTDTARLRGAGDTDAVARFVRAGSGLVAVSLGWGWKQVTGKDLVTEHAGNRLLAPVGIAWADGYLKHTAEGGYAVGPDRLGLTHAGACLEALVADAAGTRRLTASDRRQVEHVLGRAVAALAPRDRHLLPRLDRLRKQHADALVPTAKSPLRKENALARVLLRLDVTRAGRLPAEKVRAHPAAAAFPGAVPDGAPRVRRTIAIDTAVPDWHATGLYAAPGEVVTVTVPARAAGKGLHVRIGCHNDRLWHHDVWKRVPEVCRRVAVEETVTRAANAFGGPVYLMAPRRCRLGTIEAVVAGGVEMPHYVHGQTDPAAWRRTIRQRPAPWAELAGRTAVLTVPSEYVRGLDDPGAVCAHWDRVLDACADLAARPRERDRPERYVPDVQISAGYMHSGYPIMTHLDAAPHMVDLGHLMKGDWGLYHETGHNHQSPDWTFGGTVEVTVNLFTMYVLETVCGQDPTAGHGAISDATRAKKTRAYLAHPDFERWKRDPFLGLIMYIQMEQAFGWDAFKKVFAEYRRLPRAERPRSDDAKRDQWLVRFSRTVGRDLGPFFGAWHVPVSDAARKEVADLPGWMPEGFPPSK